MKREYLGWVPPHYCVSFSAWVTWDGFYNENGDFHRRLGFEWKDLK